MVTQMQTVLSNCYLLEVNFS